MVPGSSPLRVALLTRGDPGQRTGGHLYNRRMAEMAAAHAVRLETVALPERPFPLATLGVASRLSRLSAIDALVLDSIVAAEVAPWLSRLGGRPIIGLLHQIPGGVDHGRLRRAAQLRLDLIAYRRAAKLIVVSRYLADWLPPAGFDPARIVVVPPGRNHGLDGALQPGTDLRQGRALALLCVSNWMRNKGVGILLEALARLPLDTATLHLVGDDRGDHRYARELRRLLAGQDLRGRVVVHGSLEPERLAALYRGCDLFVLPSLHEAYGTACAEAMTAGLPVIAFRTDNLPYLVRDGIDGLLVDPGDIAGIAAAVSRLAMDPALRQRMGSSGQARALTLPTWEESARRFFATVSEAAVSHRP